MYEQVHQALIVKGGEMICSASHWCHSQTDEDEEGEGGEETMSGSFVFNFLSDEIIKQRFASR